MTAAKTRFIRMIVNPISGRGRRGELLRELEQRLSQRGAHIEVCQTRGPGDATRLAADAGHVDAVVAAGGDGTVREAAAGLAGTQTSLVIVPLGTENLVARCLGLTADLDRIVATIESGRIDTIDVGYANGQPFLVVGGLGFDAEVVQRLTAARNGHITHAHYVSPIWRTFWQHRFPRLTVEADGIPICDEPAMVFVGNLPRYALGLRILRDARADDGLLDLCVYRCASKPALLMHAWRTIWGRHTRSRAVTYRRARTIHVHSRDTVALELDGDVAGNLTGSQDGRDGVEFHMQTRALRIALPLQ